MIQSEKLSITLRNAIVAAGQVGGSVVMTKDSAAKLFALIGTDEFEMHDGGDFVCFTIRPTTNTPS